MKLQGSAPYIAWTEPVRITVGGHAPVFCCRVCIAMEGIRGADVEEKGFDSYEEFQEHWKAFHPE